MRGSEEEDTSSRVVNFLGIFIAVQLRAPKDFLDQDAPREWATNIKWRLNACLLLASSAYKSFLA
jgi:hypothetical protein